MCIVFKWKMNYDVIGKIFNQLDWPDLINYSTLIRMKPSQFQISSKKLKSIAFNPYHLKVNLYRNAISTGSADLCTEALLRMYMDTLDCTLLDLDLTREVIHENLRNRDKTYRINAVTRTFRRLQSYD